jgi:glycosyltransferase involved in cell wall biosynthesis
VSGGGRGDRLRIAILHQGFIPDYRVRFFERLGEMAEVQYVVFHGQAPSGSGHRAAPGPFSFANVEVRNREVRAAGKTLVYQPAIRAVAGSGFAGAVLGAELGLLANAALFPLLKLRRRPVLLWGQGGDKQEDRGGLGDAVSAVGSTLKAIAARSADGYIAYTSGGRDRLLATGLAADKVFVVRNTLDVEGEIDLHRQLAKGPEGQLREELGLRTESVVLLFVGRVYREKRLSEMVAVLRRLRLQGLDADAVEAVVIGDGPDLDRVRAEAGGLAGMHFLGEMRDREAVGRYMRVASALLIPGKVGLAVNHALAHGVPVITQVGDLHAPEFEYLEPGRNSIVAEGSTADLARAVAAFVVSPEQRAILAAGALASRDDLTVAAMARAFNDAVVSTLSPAP